MRKKDSELIKDIGKLQKEILEFQLKICNREVGMEGIEEEVMYYFTELRRILSNFTSFKVEVI